MTQAPSTPTGAVVLTGATGGIGQAIARGLALLSIPLVIVGRDAGRLKTLQQELRDPLRAIAVAADLRDGTALAAGIEAAKDRFGTIGGLIACAAAEGPIGDIDDVALLEIEETLSVNLVGTIVSCRAVLPIMRRQGWGNLVLFSSAAGHVIARPTVRSLPYQVSKFGIEGLVNGLAVQLRGTGLNVNGIRPGRTRSGANLGRDLPGLRRPEQVVESVVFLATLAPGEMSGHVLEASEFERGVRPERRDYSLS